jgi:uncharacterized protein (DUF697 family)
MNQSLLLHIVERLEGLVGKLPTTIQRPILHELTPLKELFLQQRPPRFLFVGPTKAALPSPFDSAVAAIDTHTWQEMTAAQRGTMSILDARGADSRQIEEELKRQPADAIFYIDSATGRGPRKIDIENLERCLDWSRQAGANTKVIALTSTTDRADHFREAMKSRPQTTEHLLAVISTDAADASQSLLSMLSRALPNQARIEMIRISNDKQAQHEVAQVLVKSTTAICTAIGAQPIPLADMPILTALQLVMVAGIMYVSGRERSMRAATEFVAALGVNVGAGMLFREGARSVLKFFPGWGNVVSGAIAGAGTYAIGRAAEAFFLEGVSLKEARRTYLANRRRRKQPAVAPAAKPPKPKRRRR